jgi:hypothetical protein
MFIHSNEKPLVCNICHKAFRYPSALSKSDFQFENGRVLTCLAQPCISVSILA